MQKVTAPNLFLMGCGWKYSATISSGTTRNFFGGKGAKYCICDDTLLGGVGACPPGTFLNFGWLKQHFLHFEETLEQNINVLNHILDVE